MKALCTYRNINSEKKEINERIMIAQSNSLRNANEKKNHLKIDP